MGTLEGRNTATLAYLSGNRWALWWAVTRQLLLTYQKMRSTGGRNPATIAHLSGHSGGQ
jgi:hypothetical protein